MTTVNFTKEQIAQEIHSINKIRYDRRHETDYNNGYSIMWEVKAFLRDLKIDELPYDEALYAEVEKVNNSNKIYPATLQKVVDFIFANEALLETTSKIIEKNQ